MDADLFGTVGGAAREVEAHGVFRGVGEAARQGVGGGAGCGGPAGVAAVEFIVPGEVVGKGRPRAFRMGNGIRMHTPDKTARYENLVSLSAAEAMRGRIPVMFAVELDLLLVTVPPASWSKKKRAAALAGEIRPTTKPDCDNVLKAIADACNGIVFGDDKQITDVRVRKRYGEQARAMVRVTEAV